jgi:biopolymer transport protein ExbD
MSVPQPVISKGLVPLLDIIFILLIFFLILPHSMKGEDTLYDETSAALKQFDAKLVPIEASI